MKDTGEISWFGTDALFILHGILANTGLGKYNEALTNPKLRRKSLHKINY